MAKELNNMEKAFIAEYIQNGYNGTQAYLVVNKNVKPGSARNLASRLLAKVHIQDAIQTARDEQKDQSPCVREKVLQNFSRIADKAEAVGQYGSATNAWREYGKIEGLYSENNNIDGYLQLIQQITNIHADNVQINSGATEKKLGVIALPQKNED